MGLFSSRSSTTSTTQNTTNNYDQRSVLGEGAVSGDGSSSYQESNETNINQSLDGGAIRDAFNFAGDAGSGAQIAITKVAQGSQDLSKYQIENNYKSQQLAFGLVDQFATKAQKAVADAYNDAKGAGQRGDKLIIGAMMLAGAVAMFALLRGKS